MGVRGLLSFCVVVALTASTAGAAGGRRGAGGPPAVPPTADADGCELILIDPVGDSENISWLAERYSIWRLVHPDPKHNLFVQHPANLMRTAQRYKMMIRRRPSRMIKDPNYRMASHELYPIFSEFVEEARGMGIVGQYDVIEPVVKVIDEQAEGVQMSHILQLTGPAGTGKTEFLKILDRMDAMLTATDPDFFLYTYKFKNLHGISGVEHLPENFMTLPASPFVLLPEGYRRLALQQAGARVKSLIGVDAKPFEIRDRQTDHILNAIYAHYMRKEQNFNPDDKKKMEWLSQHVDIIRHYLDPNSPPAIIGYQGGNPKDHTLFFAENPILSAIYPNTPLAFSYSGEVLRAYRRAGLLDEFWRNIADLRNVFLDVSQNGVVRNNGMFEILDSVWFMAANDESVAAARQDGPSEAQLDRADIVSQRQPIHPHFTAKTALYTLRVGNFKMKKLSDIENDNDIENGFVPLHLESVYPNPDAEGRMPGVDGRYAIRFDTPSEKPSVLVAPHSMLFMSLFASATRLATDTAAVAKESPQFSLLSQNQMFLTDPKVRLEVLLGEARVPNNSILVDLTALREFMAEGQSGMSARTVELWFRRALRKAERFGHTLTPRLLDITLKEMMNQRNGLKIPKDQNKAMWFQLLNRIKYDMLASRMEADILRILGADSGKVEQTYDEIRRELDAIQDNNMATDYSDDSGRRITIQRERLAEIQAVYQKVNGETFMTQELPRFHQQVKDDSQRFLPLVRAITHWLFNREMTEAVLGQVSDYFAGKAVTPKIRQMGDVARTSLARYGYNEIAFREALAFVTTMRNERQLRGQP